MAEVSGGSGAVGSGGAGGGGVGGSAGGGAGGGAATGASGVAPASTAAPGGAPGGASGAPSGSSPSVGAVPEAVESPSVDSQEAFSWDSWDGTEESLPEDLRKIHGPVVKRKRALEEATASEWDQLIAEFNGGGDPKTAKELREAQEKLSALEAQLTGLTTERDNFRTESERLSQTLRQSVELDTQRWMEANKPFVDRMTSDPATGEAALRLFGSKDGFGLVPSEVSALWEVAEAADVPLGEVAEFVLMKGDLTEESFDWPAVLTAVKAKYPQKTLALPPPGDSVEFMPGTSVEAPAPLGGVDNSGMSPQQRIESLFRT